MARHQRFHAQVNPSLLIVMPSRPHSFLADPVVGPVLALFGKHPLAADHLEDIGLATPSLVNFKQGFYIEGISESLSRQSWLKDLGNTDSVPYDHHLFCVGPAGVLMARLSQSTDAAGRKQYPLVLALHFGDFSLLNQVGLLAAALERGLETLRLARELTSMRQFHADVQESIMEISRNPPAPSPGRHARDSWVNSLPPGDGGITGLLRCCHALLPEGAGAGRARVPLHSSAPWPSATLWASFLHHLMGAPPCLSLLWRHGQNFADISLSPPSARVLSSIFASESSQPLTTQVPFSIAEPVTNHVQAALPNWSENSQLFMTRANEEIPTTVLNKVCQGIISWLK